MEFTKIVDDLLEEYRGLWTRLAHYDTGCKGEFQHIKDGWYVCPKCGTSYKE